MREPRQKMQSSYGENIYIECAANSEAILDLAYTWKLNGLPLADKYKENSTLVCLFYLKIKNQLY